MIKVSNMNGGTMTTYNTALNNFENFCMEKFGKPDIIDQLKENTENEVLDFLQEWINWNSKLAPVTVLNLFSRVKKYLHHRGIKIHPQDIKDELVFRRKIEEEMYPLTSDNIQTITKAMRKKHAIQFICQSSSMMRIGEVVQLRKKHLILDNKNIIVKLPASITKFSKARTTFFSKEASKLLRPLLKDMNDDTLIFGSNENTLYSETNSEQILRRILIRVGLDMKYDNGRYQINTHSFRAFGITKLSRHDSNFTKKISGQKGYLLQYDRIDDNEKLALYEKFELDLMIDSSEKDKAEIKQLKSDKENLIKANDKIRDLERKNMKAYFKELMREDEIAKLKGETIPRDEYDPSWHDKK